MMDENREYKSSVFSLLFGNPKTLRELYNALEGVTLESSVPIAINTLEGAFFKDQLNDLSFLVDNKLVVLIEHQSTINPNMPLRLLMYIGRLYEKLVDRKKRYSETLIPLPCPEFIVLYNGTEPYDDQKTLKLSDAFEKVEHLRGGDEPLELELIVKVYNVNPGHNDALLKKCEELSGYSIFVDTVRKYKKTISDKEAAFIKAIKYCIDHNILSQFLELHSSEVLNMLLEEWNIEEYGEVRWEEGRNEGRNEGRRDDARNMLRDNMPPAKVAQYTGLPLEIIQDIASTTSAQTTV
jgi:predicted transposase/invertase (TIGR01784 family)